MISQLSLSHSRAICRWNYGGGCTLTRAGRVDGSTDCRSLISSSESCATLMERERREKRRRWRNKERPKWTKWPRAVAMLRGFFSSLLNGNTTWTYSDSLQCNDIYYVLDTCETHAGNKTEAARWTKTNFACTCKLVWCQSINRFVILIVLLSSSRIISFFRLREHSLETCRLPFSSIFWCWYGIQ